MATRRRRRNRRRSYGEGAAPSGGSGLTASKKKKLILLGVGAVGVAAIALVSGSASASTPTIGRPSASSLTAGKSWIELPPASGTYAKGYYLDPKTQKVLGTTFPVPTGQQVSSADIQAAFDRIIKAYQAGGAWIEVQQMGNWAGASSAQKAASAGF